MSYGLNERSKQKWGCGFWSKRPGQWVGLSRNAGINKYYKKLTHKLERKQAKVELRDY